MGDVVLAEVVESGRPALGAPYREPEVPLRVYLDAPMNSTTGYGHEGLGMALALMRWGTDLMIHPRSAYPPWPPDLLPLMLKDVNSPFDLTIALSSPPAIEVHPGTLSASTACIGWSMWEWTSMDMLPEDEGRSDLRKRLTAFDAMLMYDEVSFQAYSEYFDGPMAVLQGGYWPELWPPVVRDWDAEPFRFVMLGALSARKEPFIAINAFRKFRQEHPEADAELVLKTTMYGLHPAMEQWCPGLKIVCSRWPKHEIDKLYASSHVMIACSRGEGKDVPCLEFLSSGGPVIATDWGGHAQWFDPAFGWAVDHVVRDEPGLPGCQMVKADEDHLAQLMWEAYSDRTTTQQKGAAGARLIAERCAWPHVLGRFFDQLPALLGPVGRRLQAAAYASRAVRS